MPSTGEKLKYRPFLVKEQKALMIAQESEDTKALENTFAQILNNCVLDDIDPYVMPMFDIEYIFLRIRGKSVGETIKLNLLCPDDNETRVDVEVDYEGECLESNGGCTYEEAFNYDIIDFIERPFSFRLITSAPKS